MLPKINPNKTKTHKELKNHFKEMKKVHMQDLFQKDKKRFEKFSIRWNDFLFDFSKNRINKKTIKLLKNLAKEAKLKKSIHQMLAGEKINEIENRAVMHIALRNSSEKNYYVDDINISEKIIKVQNKMKEFCHRFHSGEMKGYTGKKFTDIVNIGIGGSDLGPYMVTEALKPDWISGINVHYISNIDPSHIHQTMKKINFETTLFLVASKTFTTQETMTNAQTAKTMFLNSGASEKDVALHFVALSTNTEKVIEFGISQDNIFEFWDWVGGRYSLWSAIGLSIALTIGYDNFEELLRGAQEADEHFINTELEKNIPFLMASIGIWNTSYLGSESEAILPYDQYLHRFPAYMQQGNMESNGKNIDRNGKEVSYHTGPIIWGEPGTNGQHAFYQLIHQGTRIVPVDFIASVHSRNPIENQHEILLSNFFAQSEALMNGKSYKEVVHELKDKGMNPKEIKKLAPYKVFSGNRPSNSILIKILTPKNLGSLIAFYEHKIFIQGIIWNIYSFDQWGVELGKILAKKILPELKNPEGIKPEEHDSSTNGLIQIWHEWKNNK